MLNHKGPLRAVRLKPKGLLRAVRLKHKGPLRAVRHSRKGLREITASSGRPRVSSRIVPHRADSRTRAVPLRVRSTSRDRVRARNRERIITGPPMRDHPRLHVPPNGGTPSRGRRIRSRIRTGAKTETRNQSSVQSRSRSLDRNRTKRETAKNLRRI